jgi:class 3 adenylate cyclase
MVRRVPGTSPSPGPDRPALSPEVVGAISRFPDDNPNPVLRVDADGLLSYANPASREVCAGLGAVVGEHLGDEIMARLADAGGRREPIELIVEDRTWAVWPVPIRDMGFINLYGRDITAERAIQKFPDQNPNPVLRFGVDGTLLYANRASETIVSGLDLAVGGRLPERLLGQLQECAAAGDDEVVEIEAGDHVYRLLAVGVPQFGFVNVYGTDITAEREHDRLARENERLLLNILPEPIARRLREGEPLIADRFDDVTLMFADIAEFTRLSSSMSPDELVRVLNDVFSVFDDLVDRHGLEKVKTIGDAYMVVGGMPDWAPDHTARVAAMAVDLAESVGRIEAARRLGITFRIGIHCGPVVAGVIGTRKFIYDIWGDTVNLASRMESHGVPGRIQVTGAVHERLAREFRLEARGLVDVKGKGPMPTWFLAGRRAEARVVDDVAIGARPLPGA